MMDQQKEDAGHLVCSIERSRNNET
jgi:hypothetical protein